MIGTSIMKELYALMHCEFNSFVSQLGLLNINSYKSSQLRKVPQNTWQSI